MTDRNHKVGNALVTYRFPDETDFVTDVDNEILVHEEIAKLMQRLKRDGLISRFVVADDEVISPKLTRHTREGAEELERD